MNLEIGLIHFNRAWQELQKATTLDEILAFRDIAAEIKLRAERRAGEMLREGKELGQLDKGQGGDRMHGNNNVTVHPVTLSEIGVSKIQSSRWQSIAAIPEEKFEQTIREMKQAGQDLTQSAMLKVAGDSRRESSQAQETLFDIDTYRRKIKRHVCAANRHIRRAIHYRKQAFEQHRVQIPLPFEFVEEK